ncbi:MAG: Crp/Fnr family transcriptional regulator [Singulisphaera sp.]|nr:Crp/Fnr family transcriptional regulator [Singulisphaera sp.]
MAAARQLTTTTKTVPQMQGITSRWLLRLLPWVQVSGGVYRLNRRLTYTVGDGRVSFTSIGAEVRVIPQTLCELPSLRGFGDVAALDALASRFVKREFKPGDVIVESGKPADQVFLIAHGKLNKLGVGKSQPQDKHGQASIELAAGHVGEPELPGTFIDYDDSPREYHLSVAQTMLRVHTRIADLYNDPMNQVEQQLRLTIEALRERQESEMINNREFGLLHNADFKQRIHPRTGPPTPDDLDELVSRRRKSRFFLAHPHAIAAFGRECSRRGVYPQSIEVNGHKVLAWRGVPIYPCNKIPITETRTSSFLVMRIGEEDQGVVGLHQTGIPDEYEPGLSVRFMGINKNAIISYLVSAYYSVAVLVPDALGILENVEIRR